MGLLPDVAQDVGVSMPQAGHVISAYALGVVVGAPLIAVALARAAAPRAADRLMAAFFVGNALSALATGYRLGRGLRGSSPACRTAPISASRRWSRPRWCR